MVFPWFSCGFPVVFPRKPRADLAKNERVPPPRQALEMGGAARDPPKTTAYVAPGCTGVGKPWENPRKMLVLWWFFMGFYEILLEGYPLVMTVT